MATIQAKVITLTTPNATTGAQAYTGAGFTPQIVLFFGNNCTSVGSAVDMSFMIGAGISTTSERAASIVSADAAANSDTGKYVNNSKSLTFTSVTGTILESADLTSLDADGFTLNYNVSDAVTRKVAALCLAGFDNVATGQFQMPTATDAQYEVTGVGFQPDAIMLFHTNSGAAAPPAGSTNAGINVGFASGASAQWASAYVSQDNQNTMNTYREQVTSAVLVGLNTAGTNTDVASMYATPFTADGFDLNVTTSDATANYVQYVAFKGGTFAAGAFNAAGSTGEQTVTTGFTSKVVLLSSFNNATTASILSHNRGSWGMAVSSSNRACVWHGDTDAVADAIADSDFDDTKCLKLMTEGTPTTNAAADFVAHDATAFRITWPSVSGSTEEIVYFAIGDSASSGQPTMKRHGGQPFSGRQLPARPGWMG